MAGEGKPIVVDEGTPIVISARSAWLISGTIVATGVAAITFLVLGGDYIIDHSLVDIRANISEIKDSVKVVDGGLAKNSDGDRESQVALITRIGELNSTISSLSGRLEMAIKSVDGLNTRIDDLNRVMIARDAYLKSGSFVDDMKGAISNANIDSKSVVIIPLNTIFPPENQK